VDSVVSEFVVASSLWLEQIGAQRRHYNPNQDTTMVSRLLAARL
jgi:hypothetical protein